MYLKFSRLLTTKAVIDKLIVVWLDVKLNSYPFFPDWLDVKCELNPGYLPFFGALESRSAANEDDLYQIGDIVIISCLTQADKLFEVHKFVCGENATWNPDIQDTLPPQCLLVCIGVHINRGGRK